MNAPVIETVQLRKSFKRVEAVAGIDLHVARGSVFGFIGRNGAGKTTTIQLLLGLLEPTSGASTVLGMESVRESLEIRRRVGYVPEQHHMYEWMSVAEITGFVAPFYPTWGDGECQRLLRHFDLDPAKKVKELSKGMVAKLALVMALAHRPEILILDESTGGLDAIVRREFLESIVDMIESGERTVLISSHLLADVERVADQVAVIDQGKLIVQEPMSTLKSRVRSLRLRFDAEPPAQLDADGMLRAERHGNEWVVTVDNFTGETPQALKQRFSGSSVEVVDLGLEDVFVALVGNSSAGAKE